MMQHGIENYKPALLLHAHCNDSYATVYTIGTFHQSSFQHKIQTFPHNLDVGQFEIFLGALLVVVHGLKVPTEMACLAKLLQALDTLIRFFFFMHS